MLRLPAPCVWTPQILIGVFFVIIAIGNCILVTDIVLRPGKVGFVVVKHVVV